MNFEAQKANKKTGKDIPSKEQSDSQVISWCDFRPDIYITLYRVEKENENKTILAVANKKLVDEEINLSNDTGIPTAICYRN